MALTPRAVAARLTSLWTPSDDGHSRHQTAEGIKRNKVVL